MEAGLAELGQRGICRLEWESTTRYAVPVTDADGCLIAAIGLSVPLVPVPTARDATIVHALLTAAHALSTT